MKGSEINLTAYLEGPKNRYVIPVYQRRYSWKEGNCRQLYNDLKRVVTEGRSGHFFGSIVSTVIGGGDVTEHHIIDGQQRLTTLTLLLLAMRNLIRQGRVTVDDANLANEIDERFLIDKWAKDDKMKLLPVQGDREALNKLFSSDEGHVATSRLTLNYRFFCDTLEREQEVSVRQLFDAVGKLVVISITLGTGDNAQLIFESLNSTGLALEEGDKIRNYVLMGQPPQTQASYYEKYWKKIEECTKGAVSTFVRDYLSIKQQATPRIDNVYPAFKAYNNERGTTTEALLQELLSYARIYRQLVDCRCTLSNKKTERRLNACLYRLSRLDITMVRPFTMEVLRLCIDGLISEDDTLRVFLIVEGYIVRRHICSVPTNALNKIFVALNGDILRHDDTTKDYVDKMVYTLRAKRDSGRWPTDEEFARELAQRQIYQLRARYREYLFERYENHGTGETKDVFDHLDAGDYSVEHIMPQHLTPAWTTALGEHAETIHATWLHRLANLTLTGYNSQLSNRTFAEKRDAKGGYRDSGLRINQKIALKESWGEADLEERNSEMIAQALEIWPLPATAFAPAQKAAETLTPDDEPTDFTGKNIVAYCYRGKEYAVSTWAAMFENVVKMLHDADRSVLATLADSDEHALPGCYVSSDATTLRRAMAVGDGLYVEKNTSTEVKIAFLKKLLPLYDASTVDLTFRLRESNGSRKSDKPYRHALRKRYWEQALPVIRQSNAESGLFGKVGATASDFINCFFDANGYNISCRALLDRACTSLWLDNGDAAKNKAMFDMLYSHKDEIEQRLGTQLVWDRGEGQKRSSVTVELPGVSLKNEDDWPAMANFHARWSRLLHAAVVPYLAPQHTLFD